MRQLPFEYAVRNLGRSVPRLAAFLTGSTLVVLLVLAAGGFVRGMQRTLASPPTLHENAVLLGAGSEESIERSEISATVPSVLAASVAGIRREAGVDFISPEVHAALPVKESAGSDVDLIAVFRGVEPPAMLVHPEVEIVEGRFPVAGRDELMVGSLAAARMGVRPERLAVGSTLHLDRRDWTIVGRFSAPGTVMDAEVWTPLRDLMIATRRTTVSCVFATLDAASGGAEFADVDLFARTRLDLELVAMRERDYYGSVAAFYRPIRLMIWVTAALIALGGVLGGLNTMYAAFASRVREVGMLQAIGFRRSAIVVSLTEESLLASMGGAVIASALGLALLDGVAVAFSMGAFALVVDAPVLLGGLGAGALVGLIGAGPPAVRCLRLSIPEALKSS